jgi:hypothetical protein
MVEPLFNVPQFKVFCHLPFSLNDPKSLNPSVKFSPVKIFLSLVFKSAAPQENLKWRFQCTNDNFMFCFWPLILVSIYFCHCYSGVGGSGFSELDQASDH